MGRCERGVDAGHGRYEEGGRGERKERRGGEKERGDVNEHIIVSVFGCTPPTLAHRADLPIAWSYHRGMLDVAHYLNKQTVKLSHEVGFSTQVI